MGVADRTPPPSHPQALYLAHSGFLQEGREEVVPALRALQKAVGQAHQDLRETMQRNRYRLEFVLNTGQLRAAPEGPEGRGPGGGEGRGRPTGVGVRCGIVAYSAPRGDGAEEGGA